MNILCFILLSGTFILFKNISNIKFSFCLFLLCCHSPGSFGGNNQNAKISVRFMDPDSSGSFGHRASDKSLEGIWASSGCSGNSGATQTGEGKKKASLTWASAFILFIRHRFLNAWALWGGGWRGQGSIAGFTEQHLERHTWLDGRQQTSSKPTANHPHLKHNG